MQTKPVALQLWTLREMAKQDFLGVLKLLGKIGYAGIEPAGLFDMTAKDVRKVLDDQGMKCCSVHSGIPTKETINARVDEAAALGTKLLVAGLGPKDFATAESRQAGFARIQEATALCAAAGVRFVYHNHNWEFDKIDGRLGYDLLMQAVPGMFSEVDTYWAANFGQNDPAVQIRQYAPRVPLLHIKDGPLVQGEPNVAVGTGKMNFPAMVAAADPNVLTWLIVEFDRCATDMPTAVEESLKYLVKAGLGHGK
jgi:sugar phosphate isomerase/epimerase